MTIVADVLLFVLLLPLGFLLLVAGWALFDALINGF